MLSVVYIGVIPDEAKALSLLAPANAVAGILPGGGLLPTPNPLASVSPQCYTITLLNGSRFISVTAGQNHS